MTHHSIIFILTFALLMAFSLIVCGQAPNKTSADKTQFNQNSKLMFDTSKTAIIELNKASRYPFDSTFQSASLTQNELQTVDSFLLVCVTDYNTKLDKDNKEWSIDLKNRNYRKQLIVVTNKEGQKEVWVNCFCRVSNDKWKTKMFGVDDGGNCYFDFKVNLTLKKYYDLSVNGVA